MRTTSKRLRPFAAWLAVFAVAFGATTLSALTSAHGAGGSVATCPPIGCAPTPTRSLYVDTNSTQVMNSMGQQQGQAANLASSQNRVILHFGQPFYGTIDPNSCYNQPTFPGNSPHYGFLEEGGCHITFSTMRSLVKAYIKGYVAELQSRGVVVPLRIAVGPNNAHLSTLGTVETNINLTTHAQQLADKVQDLNLFIQRYGWTSYASVRATGDFEPDWDRYAPNTSVNYLGDYDKRITSQGYGGATQYWWDGGSADGCNQNTTPNGPGSTLCNSNHNGNWTQDTIIQLSWTGPSFSGTYPYPYAYAFPQVYHAAFAQQWANISWRAANTPSYGSGPVAPFGPLASNAFMPLSDAWSDLYDDLWNYSSTRSAASQLVSTTKIYHSPTG